MRIIVNHLTRMQKGFMCVAGIDPDTMRHVRPVLASQMRIDMLSCHGGPFELGHVVELGETRFVGKVPEIEDRQFEASAARRLDQVPCDKFREMMAAIAAERLAIIFGPDLQPMGAASCGVVEYQGLRSLGCYWAERPRLELRADDDRARIRFSFTEGNRRLIVPVADIRLYGADHVTPCAESVRRFANAIAGNPRALVSVGLSRAYKRTEADPAVHWLQVNNVHLP